MDHERRAGARRKAERHGRFAEYVAAFYLLLKGYRIAALRYRTKAGEIDIIARKGDIVAFIEVKARREAVQSVDAVTALTQRRIRAAGDQWLARQVDFPLLSCRYDIVAVAPWAWPRHFPDAF